MNQERKMREFVGPQPCSRIPAGDEIQTPLDRLATLAMCELVRDGSYLGMTEEELTKECYKRAEAMAKDGYE